MTRSIIGSKKLRFDGYVKGTSFRRYAYLGKNVKCYLIPASCSLLNIKEFEVSKSVYLATFNSINFN